MGIFFPKYECNAEVIGFVFNSHGSSYLSFQFCLINFVQTDKWIYDFVVLYQPIILCKKIATYCSLTIFITNKIRDG